ncbi:MAG: hypothetical protein GWO20_13520 [Candidatus Korarchaeota archaeon]|nr:hypothetical protein [Candidatus Korarchaeota archaeon]NIU84411.1 hypothetical protein [Candidatus Thorarchaeota archaeon]NIW14520.1 hypothetical protein [Candidatus Thorarchaeota archaeon]NIW52599.1 hypothetical protein [Candidatus Korarchaeota archaeon]
MTKEQSIGDEARKLDEKSLIERMKLDKQALRKIGWAILFYIGMMVLMELFL